MRADVHIHTRFSCDSEAEMRDYAAKAARDGIDIMCFTDHVDHNVNDYGYNYYDSAAYFENFAECEALCRGGDPGGIELLSGMEFSEPHLYPEQLRALSARPYDFIIGSVHWIGDMFPCREVREKYPAPEFYALYWREVLETVKAGGFDSLGHIDFPKRYYGELCYDEAQMREIFARVLDAGAVIEINTSSLRKGLDEPMPGAEILALYRDCGGRYVTIGSDAHAVCDAGAGIDDARRLAASFGLREVVFRERKLYEI